MDFDWTNDFFNREKLPFMDFDWTNDFFFTVKNCRSWILIGRTIFFHREKLPFMDFDWTNDFFNREKLPFGF